MNVFFDKRANEEDGYGQEALSAGAVGGGGLLASKKVDKVTGMETRYHGTGAAAAESIKQNGLLGSKAGEGVSTKRANLENRLGKDAIQGKTYLAKDKKVATDFGLQAGLANQGIKSGQPTDLIYADSPREGIQKFLAAKKDSTILKAKIPYNDLNGGRLNVVPNPELEGLSREEFVDKHTQRMLGGHDGIMRHQVGAGYDALGQGTDVIQGDVDSHYFKGGQGHSRQSLRGVIEYAKTNPGRFSKGLGGVGAGLGVAGAGAYGMYDGISNREKEATEMNLFLSKQANEEVYQALQMAEERRRAIEHKDAMLKQEEAEMLEHDEGVGSLAVAGGSLGAGLGGYIPTRAFGVHTPMRMGAALTGVAVGGIAGLVGGHALGEKVYSPDLERFREEKLNPAIRDYQDKEDTFQARMIDKRAFTESRIEMEKIAAWFGSKKPDPNGIDELIAQRDQAKETLRSNAAVLSGQEKRNRSTAATAAAAQAPKPTAVAAAAKPAAPRKPMPDFGDYFKSDTAAKPAEPKPTPASEPTGSRVANKASGSPKVSKGKVALIGGALASTGAAVGLGNQARKKEEEQQKVAYQNILSDMEKFASRIR